MKKERTCGCGTRGPHLMTCPVSPSEPLPKQDPHVRFWSKVRLKTKDECWEWTGNLNPTGYGLFFVEVGQTVPAHRYSYELLRGEIPPGYCIDHLCRNHSCINPNHLEAVTPRENTLRGNAPNILLYHSDRCSRGHLFTPENTYEHHGSRICKTCKKMHNEESKKKKKIQQVARQRTCGCGLRGPHQNECPLFVHTRATRPLCPWDM